MKENTRVLQNLMFQENLTFWKMLLFIIKSLIWQFFNWPMSLYRQCAHFLNFFVVVNFLRISFNELLKGTTIIILNIFKTYTFVCYLWYVMCDAWCVMFQTWFCVQSSHSMSQWETKKYPTCVVLGHLSDILKLTPDGSSMYTLSCKASYRVY